MQTKLATVRASHKRAFLAYVGVSYVSLFRLKFENREHLPFAVRKEFSMPIEPEKPTHAWEEIAKQLNQEQDRSRVAELAQKLNQAMLAEEREKVRQRL